MSFNWIKSLRSKRLITCLTISKIGHAGLLLEAEYLVLELADGTGLSVAKGFSSFLHCANHGRRTAEKNLHVVRWSRETFLKYLLAVVLVTESRNSLRSCQG